MKNRGRLVYTFCAFADLHIDCEGFYSKSAERWTQALRFAAEKNADFIVSAGDNVTNAYGSKEEWELFNSLIAQSDFHNPVWSANGNHDLRCGKERGTEAFMQATALDDVPYFYRTEPKSGDLFIFMAQESEYNSAASDQFSDAQMLWLETLLDKYCAPEITYDKIDGGLFIWCRLPDGVDMPAFVRDAIDHKVCVVPGNAFLTDETEETNGFRINFSTPTDEQLEKGIKALGDLIKSY